jgi:hypothetical protein
MMDKKNYTKLSDILESTLSAHRLADWNSAAARKIIIKSIVRRFKDYIQLYEEKK